MPSKVAFITGANAITGTALIEHLAKSSTVPAMKEQCSEVTHAYFSSYVHEDDSRELNEANARLFENFLDALIAVAPRLECVVLQTGGKHYNVHLGPVASPSREEEPRRDSPIGNFYFHQEDYLVSRQRGQSLEMERGSPKATIGHTIKPNGAF